ncbi:N-6 DNA methylase [Nocardia sp. NPDC048505]|uniref:Eco57I restriction-modification methylase domain-containing protein n=1 Tax=unclassified Nocardia TaxID=2637762 RepID=UPI0033F56A08
MSVARERKRHGRHYTPPVLASFLAARLLAHVPSGGVLRVLDPACGDGELLLAVRREAAARLPGVRLELSGYDLDGTAVARARDRAGSGITWHSGDFLAASADLADGAFDAIITNPPYVRTQQLGGTTARLLSRQFGLSGRIDLTHPFVAVAARLLGAGGVLGLLCANRFLTTRAGANVRAILRAELAPVELYDLGDTKLFEAAVLPAVTIAKRGIEPGACRFASAYEAEGVAGARDLFDALTGESGCLVGHNGRTFAIEVGTLSTGQPPAGSLPREPAAGNPGGRDFIERTAAPRASADPPQVPRAAAGTQGPGLPREPHASGSLPGVQAPGPHRQPRASGPHRETAAAIRARSSPNAESLAGQQHRDHADIGAWRMSRPELDAWLAGVEAATWKTFGEVGRIRVGIKTTADRVFISDRWPHVDPCPEPELLFDLITHHDLEPWRIARARDTRVLYPYDITQSRRIPVDLREFPGAAEYLQNHRALLAGRKYVIEGGREWFEIWVPQRPHLWQVPKLVFPDISVRPRFAFDRSGAVVNGDCYWISLADIGAERIAYLLMGVANSALGLRFYDAVCGNRLYSGRRRWITQYVSRLPVPDPGSRAAADIVGLVGEFVDGRPLDAGAQQVLDERVELAFAG